MSLKTERAVNEAVMKTNASKWENLKRLGRKTLLSGVSAVSIAFGMFSSSPQMYAQNPNVVTVSVNDLDAYLRGGQTASSGQSNQQQYAQVYANRDAYRQTGQRGVSLSADGSMAYENGCEYYYSHEFNDGHSGILNDRAVIGVYENCNNNNDYIMVTAPMDCYGQIIPDGRLTATHHSYEYLRDAKAQGHTGYCKRQHHNGGYYGRGYPHGSSKAGRVARDVGHVVGGIIDIISTTQRGGR